MLLLPPPKCSYGSVLLNSRFERFTCILLYNRVGNLCEI